MRRIYKNTEFSHKIKLLTEYYKFHHDIPRLFMLPETNTLNNFHDKKRRFEYFWIARLIEEENKKNPSRPPKGIVGDKPAQLYSEDTDTDQKKNDKEVANIPQNILKDISTYVNRGLNSNYHTPATAL